MWEIMFQPKDAIKVKGRLVGVYIQDEHQFKVEHTTKEIDNMTKIKSDGLAVRDDPKRFNYTCYVDYDKEFDETFIHIVVKEED